jgi:kynurenine formamidase
MVSQRGISLKGHRVVDLTARLVSRVTRLDASIEEGQRDVYNMPWMVEETVNDKDLTIEHLVAANRGTLTEWPLGAVSGHMGSHIQLGVGHNDNWSGLPEGMLGLWDLPVDAYYGEAAVCILDDLKGEPILPEHLSNVREGDIVLMGSRNRGKDTPWIHGDTAYWLAEEMKIKMLSVGVPGIAWETKPQDPEPFNCPTHRAMTGNNIPITYPLSNVETLTKERCFFLSLPLNVERMEGTWIRAIAIEEE